MKDWDCSMTREIAERRLGVKTNTVSLDELAKRLSLSNDSELLSVRDHTKRPIPSSGVWQDGVKLEMVPYFVHYHNCVLEDL